MPYIPKFVRTGLFAFTCLCLMAGIGGCQVGRFVWYNFANITDYKIFPSRNLEASSPRLIPDVPPEKQPRNTSITIGGKTMLFSDFLSKTGTVAFVVVRNDSIQYEWYGNGYSESDQVASFSMAKSWVGALVFIAIAEGKIKHFYDPITLYVPELKGKNGFDKITIQHLLDMCSGIRFSEGYYSPFSGAARSYYGRDLKRLVRHLKIDHPSGEVFEYKSINTQLLGMALSNIYSRPLTVLLEEKLWKPLGCEFNASWSLDHASGHEKAFCCINARARDFARLGMLFLNWGYWDGKQLIPQVAINHLLENHASHGSLLYSDHWWHGVTSVALADSGKMNDLQKQFYARHKVIRNGRILIPDGNFYAQGLLGQYCYVNRKSGTVLVRLGKKEGKGVHWPSILKSISGY